MSRSPRLSVTKPIGLPTIAGGSALLAGTLACNVAVVSEEAINTPQPDPQPDRSSEPAPDATATVLPFPSNRPLDRSDDHGDDHVEPTRLRDVIGDVLRDERRRQERTLADVAERAAVSLPYLSEVERGRKEVSSDLLDAIGTALDLPLVEILERSAARLRTDVRMVTRMVDQMGATSMRSGAFRGQRTTRFQLAA